MNKLCRLLRILNPNFMCRESIVPSQHSNLPILPYNEPVIPSYPWRGGYQGVSLITPGLKCHFGLDIMNIVNPDRGTIRLAETRAKDSGSAMVGLEYPNPMTICRSGSTKMV